ncbi:MAG: hypothetical protein M3209_09640 [Acidobacteriota bacterium]|nr:hypothetical protein [Acidobacteriota bacterium]
MKNHTCVNCNHDRTSHNRVGKYCLDCWGKCDFLAEREEYVRRDQRLIVTRFANRVVVFSIFSERSGESKEFRYTRKFFDEVFLPSGGWQRVVEQEVFDPNEAVGMNANQAAQWFQQFGYAMRITRKNGDVCIVTRDYRLDRINVAVENGKVAGVLSVG